MENDNKPKFDFPRKGILFLVILSLLAIGLAIAIFALGGPVA